MKVIRRDLGKVGGTYLEEIHVICTALATDPVDPTMLRFEWILNSEFTLQGFKFGVDPIEYPPDE